jgi:sugar phosphate permease
MFALGGSAALLMGSIPLVIAGSGRASSAAGTITAVHNIGGGLAGVLVGQAIDQAGWSGVFALWAFCGLAAFSLNFLVLKNSTSPGASS